MFEYLSYLFRHKFYVFKAGLKLNVSLWRLIVHDWSKLFFINEFIGYKNWFYKNGNYPFYAVNHHQKFNKHHWQYWLLVREDGSYLPLDIPHIYLKEMVADWAGSGRVKSGYWDLAEYYTLNKEKIIISKQTRQIVEILIDNFYGISR